MLNLTLNAPIATKVVCFSRLLKCLRSIYCKQCGPRSDCVYRSSLFWVHAACFYTYICNSSVMLSNYLQQTTSADDLFRCIYFWRFKGKQHHFARDIVPQTESHEFNLSQLVDAWCLFMRFAVC